MNRRGLLRLSATAAGLAIVSACGVLHVADRKLWQVGVLAPDDGQGVRWDAFRGGLRDLGWNESENITTSWRMASGNTTVLDGLAADLVALGIDILVTGGTEAAMAAQRATRTIPIVLATVNDPVGTGLIASYAHPGGNLTGSALLSPQLTPKWMELIAELVPGMRDLAILTNGENPSTRTLLDEMRASAPAGVQLHVLDVRRQEDLIQTLELASERAQALFVVPDFLFYVSRAKLVQLAVENRLPALYPSREYADAGGLLSYGANQVDLYRRAAGFVDRILNGARAGDLPFEQPSTFELVANQTAAQQLGVTFPTSILLQAAVIR